MELVGLVNNSKCSKLLHNRARYDLYRDPAVSEQQYIQWLDVDFDNKQHLFKTAILAQSISDMDGSDAISATLAINTALIHDCQEAIKSDVNYNFKTKDSDLEEADILVQMTKNGLLNVPIAIAKSASKIMKAKVLEDPLESDTLDKEEVIVFDLAERIGYLLSAQTAWQESLSPPEDMPINQVELLKILAANVLSNQYLGLVKYAIEKKRCSALYVLTELHHTFGEIFKYSCDDLATEKRIRFYTDNGFSTDKIRDLEYDLQRSVEVWHEQTVYT